jgi:pentatricopeptide repeat protein
MIARQCRLFVRIPFARYTATLSKHHATPIPEEELERRRAGLKLRRALKRQGIEAAERFMNELPEKQIDNAKYAFMIHSYVKNGLYQKAHETFDEMIERGYKPDDRTMGSLINAFGAVGNIRRAEYVFNDMLSMFKIEPTDFLVKALLQAYYENHLYDKAAQLFETTQVKGKFAHEMMIRVFFKTFRQNEAEAVFEQMKKNGIEIDLSTYIEMAAGYYKLDKRMKAITMLRQVNVIEDTSKYFEIMEFLIKAGFTSESVKILGYFFFKLHIKPIQKLFTSIVSSYLYSHKHNEAKQVLFTMIEDFGLQPDEVMFSTIVAACYKTKAQNQIEFIRETLMNKYNIEFYNPQNKWKDD